MKRRNILCIAILMFASGVPFAKAAPNEDLKDFIVYFRSVRTPAVLALCTPVVVDKDQFSATANNWLDTNGDTISRGKKVALSRVANEQMLDEANSKMLTDVKSSFERSDAKEKTRFCADAYDSYQAPKKQ